MQRKTTIETGLYPFMAPLSRVSGTMLGVMLVLGALSACSPTLATRGNFVEDDRLKTLQVQVSSKDEVARTLGTPTTKDPFDDNRWFYIGEKTETTAFYDPDVKERKVLLVTFNDDGFLQAADLVDESAAQQVEIVKKKTPAPGREINAFEQFVGNIGKFNQSAGASGVQQQTPGR